MYKRLPKNLLSATIVITAVTLFAQYWNVGHSNISELLNQPTPANTPDLYLVETKTRRFNKQGQLEQLLVSERATHRPVTDVIQLSNPHLQTYENGKEAWDVQANDGETLPGSDTLKLSGDVIIKQLNGSLTLRTNSLTIDPDTKHAESDQAITLTSETGKMTGVGMKASLNTQKFELLSRVRSHHEPR